MFSSRKRCLAFASLLGLLGLASAGAQLAATNRHVLLITIDGLAASYLKDSEASLPTLRRLAAAGAAAEALHVSNPTVTWANHTTLVTGVHPDKHSVLFNGIMYRRGAGASVNLEGERDQKELVAAPTIYDVLHMAGLRCANINWPCTSGARTLHDNFPDVPNALAHTTPRLRLELIRTGILGSDDEAAFRSGGAVRGDEVWKAAAVHLIRTRPPNLLLLHLLAPDTVQHKHGPNSTAAYTALALADAHIAEVLRALDESGLRERTTIFITSDHGFDQPKIIICPNIVFRKAGLFRPPPNRRAQAVSEGGTAFVYLTNPATQAADRARVIGLLRGHEGIAQVLEPKDYPALRLPDPAKNPQMGDLLLVPQEGYAFANEAFEDEVITELTITAGSHGYLASNPKMDGIFIAAGRGIRPGTKLQFVDNVDVAPTIAALFGVKLPTAEGREIPGLLTDSTSR